MTFDLPDFLDLAYEKNSTPVKMRIDVSTFNDDELLKALTCGLRVLTYPKAQRFSGKIVTSQAIFPQELQLRSM